MQLVDDSGNAAMEASCLVQLGRFAKLPTEIRLSVWEALFCLISTKLDHVNEHPTNTLSILCCSRYLYNEIAHHLYANTKRSFCICSRQPENLGIKVILDSKWFIVNRHLNDIQTARDLLEHFPRTKMRDDSIYVNIRRSSGDDPGRIVLLSERVNRFVKTLTELSYSPCIHVQLVGRWLRHGKARESIEDPAEYRPDYDIVLFPFTRLSNWDYHLPEDLSTAISNETKLSNEPITKRSMISLLREHGHNPNQSRQCLNTNFDGVDSSWLFEQWLTDTRIFLDTKLDCLPGPTANLLRRRRFAQWFEDGIDFKSHYEKRFIEDITNNLRLLMKHDPRLHQARLRHRCAILKHHQIQVERHGKSPRGVSFCQPWDSRIWATARPNGIEPVTCTEIKTEEARMVYGYYNFFNKEIAQFSRDLHWWGVDSQEIFNKRKPWWFECVGCQELGRPCRWCEEYDVDKACRLCRERGFDQISHVS